MEHGFGYIPSEYDVRDYVLRQSVEDVPLTWQNNPIRIKNQGQRSTCTAHVMCELVEYHNHKESGRYVPFSTEFVYGFRNIDKDDDYLGEGMRLRDGLRIIQTYGDVTEAELPGNNNCDVAMNNVRNAFGRLKESAYENRITSYYKIRSIDEMKYSLYHDGPVAAGIRWYKGMTADPDGILVYDKQAGFGGHAVMIVGYDQYGLIAQNSWGRNWGNLGTFRIAWDEYDTMIGEAYGVTDDIKAVRKPVHNMKLLSTLVNLFVRLFTK